MSFMRNFALYGLLISSVALLIALLVFWLLDKPLYLKQSENLVEENDKLLSELKSAPAEEAEQPGSE